MQDFETVCFQNRADWVRLLAEYAAAEEIAAAAEVEAAKSISKVAPAPVSERPMSTESDGDESATGWVSRISTLEGVDAALLSTLHGRVIALGYLKFKLIDRQVGLRYRLTPAGRQMAHSTPEVIEAAA